MTTPAPAPLDKIVIYDDILRADVEYHRSNFTKQDGMFFHNGIQIGINIEQDRTLFDRTRDDQHYNIDLLHNGGKDLHAQCAFLYFFLTVPPQEEEQEEEEEEEWEERERELSNNAIITLKFDSKETYPEHKHLELYYFACEFVRGVISCHGGWEYNQSITYDWYTHWQLQRDANVKPFDGRQLYVGKRKLESGDFEKPSDNLVTYKGRSIATYEKPLWIVMVGTTYAESENHEKAPWLSAQTLQGFLFFAVTPAHSIEWKSTLDVHEHGRLTAYINGFLTGALVAYDYHIRRLDSSTWILPPYGGLLTAASVAEPRSVGLSKRSRLPTPPQEEEEEEEEEE